MPDPLTPSKVHIVRNHQFHKTHCSLVPKGVESDSPVKKRGNDSIVEEMTGSGSTDSDSSDKVKVLLFE